MPKEVNEWVICTLKNSGFDTGKDEISDRHIVKIYSDENKKSIILAMF